jgi:competence protein ComEA
MNGTWLDRNRHLIFGLLLLMTLVGAGLFYWWQPAQSSVEIVTAPASPTPTTPVAPTATPAPVRVYVTGAVVKSDVYFLPAGSIIKDAIMAAGGFTSEADPERINQALELQDQQQIHVPRLGEQDAPPPVQDAPASQSGKPGPDAAPVSGALINLNLASLEELDSLPGIGPAIAGRIIDYRQNNGNFKSVEALTEVSGIGQATLAKIKPLVTVE